MAKWHVTKEAGAMTQLQRRPQLKIARMAAAEAAAVPAARHWLRARSPRLDRPDLSLSPRFGATAEQIEQTP
jgi:hypothetical protein